MKRNRNPLIDTDPMPFGEFRGKAIGSLPLSYLDFLLRQPWLVDWPNVHGYVKAREAEIIKARPKLESPKILSTYDDYMRWARR